MRHWSRMQRNKHGQKRGHLIIPLQRQRERQPAQRSPPFLRTENQPISPARTRRLHPHHSMKTFFTRERVVAYKIFDINGVDFEQQLERFVCTHLNACHNCQSNPNGSQNSKSIETAPGDPAVASSKTYEATPTSNDIKTSIKFGPSSSIHNGALDNSAPSRTPHMISNSVSEFEFTVQQSQ